MFGQTIITRYQDVKRSASRNGKCISCGKKRIRKFSVCHTVNPFNKNKEGEVKSYSEVSNDVSAKLASFLSDFDKRGFKCAGCEDELHCQSC